MYIEELNMKDFPYFLNAWIKASKFLTDYLSGLSFWKINLDYY